MKNEKYYYVFTGQNATTGEPNRKTGRMSYYGCILKFSTKEGAEKYAEKKYSSSARDICEMGTARTLRKYCMGMSVRNYEDYLHHLQEDEVTE